MHSGAQVAAVSRKMLWTGRVLSGIPAALVLFGAIMKIVKAAPVITGMAEHGVGQNLIVLIGVIELFALWSI